MVKINGYSNEYPLLQLGTAPASKMLHVIVSFPSIKQYVIYFPPKDNTCVSFPSIKQRYQLLSF